MSSQPDHTQQADHPPSPLESGHELQRLTNETGSRPGSLGVKPLMNTLETSDISQEGVGSAAGDDQDAEQESLLTAHQSASTTTSNHNTVHPTVDTPQPPVNKWKWKWIWQRIEKHWHNTWTPELLCCGIASVSLVAIGLILDRYNGEPLPHLGLGITLNTLVSFLVIMLKAGVALPTSEGMSMLLPF